MPVPQLRKPKSGWHAPGTPCTSTKLFLTVSNASHWVFDSGPVPLTSSSSVETRAERHIILERKRSIIEMSLVQSRIISHFFHVKNKIAVVAVWLEWIQMKFERTQMLGSGSQMVVKEHFNNRKKKKKRWKGSGINTRRTSYLSFGILLEMVVVWVPLLYQSTSMKT